MATDERGYLVVPHAVLKVDCDGCLMVIERGDMADLTCNMCDTVVRTVPLEQAASALVEIASTEISSARCPHCGAVNVFPGFSAIMAFVCSGCGEGVSVDTPVQ